MELGTYDEAADSHGVWIGTVTVYIRISITIHESSPASVLADKLLRPVDAVRGPIDAICGAVSVGECVRNVVLVLLLAFL